MLSPRRLSWRGRSLRCLHLGPIAVHPEHQGRGLGRRLLDALERQALSQGFDLLHLTAVEGGGAARLYASAGFHVLQSTRPWLRSLPKSGGSQRAAFPWPSRWPALPVEADTLQEQTELPTRVPSMLCPHLIRAHGGAALTLRWPVQQPHGRWAWSTQVIALQRPSPGLLDAVATRAAADRSVALWGMADRVGGLEGFEEGAPSSAHMAKGLSPEGREAVAEAKGYSTFGPAG